MTALTLGRRLLPHAAWQSSDRRQAAAVNVGPFHLHTFIGIGNNAGRWSIKIIWLLGKPAFQVLWCSTGTQGKHEGPEEALQAALGWLRAVRVGMDAALR